MRGRRSEVAEVVGCGSQAAAEEVVPDAVGDHPPCQRVVGPQEIVGEFQPAAVGRLVGRGVDHGEKAAGHGLARLLVVAAGQERLVAAHGLRHARHPLGRHDLRFEPAVFLDQRPRGSELIELVLEDPLCEAGVEKQRLGIARCAFAPAADGPFDGPHVAGPPVGERLRLRRERLVEDRVEFLVGHGGRLGHLRLRRRCGRGARVGRRLFLHEHRLADRKPRPLVDADRQRHVAGRRQFDVDVVTFPIGEIERVPLPVAGELLDRVDLALPWVVLDHRPERGAVIARREHAEFVLLVESHGRRGEPAAVFRRERERLDAGRPDARNGLWATGSHGEVARRAPVGGAAGRGDREASAMLEPCRHVGSVGEIPCGQRRRLRQCGPLRAGRGPRRQLRGDDLGLAFGRRLIG